MVGRWTFGSALVGALALAVSPVATTPQASESSACALLTPTDLHAVLGGTVGDGQLTTAPKGGETICEWTITTSAGGGFSAQLDVKSLTAKEFKQQRRIASGRTTTVPHLGDAAFSERVKIGTQVFDDLWVHHGTTAFRLEVLKDLGTQPLARLAPIVLGRLTASTTTT
jgi:hypothetical protein